LYQRSSPVTHFGTVSCKADDLVGLIARTSVRKGRFYESKDLVDTATETDSLLHLITRLATKRDIFNFLSNSSFENATIGDSWLVTTGGTLNKDAADGLFGSASGELIPGLAAERMVQTVSFTGTKKLNVGETYTYSAWVKSTAAASSGDNGITIVEFDGAVQGADTTVAYTLAGGEGYKKISVSRTITSSDTDRLRVDIAAAAGDTINIDGAMLIQGDRALNYFVLNNNDGVAGVSSADDADSDSYDIIGFDVQSVAITHPWRRVDQGASIWNYLKDLGDATVASYIGLNSAGTFVHRSRFATDYEDPIPYGVIDAVRNVSTKIDVQNANRIVVHGVKIIKRGRVEIMWVASGSDGFNIGTDGRLTDTVANGASWPGATYGVEFIANYGDNNQGTPATRKTPPDDSQPVPDIYEVPKTVARAVDAVGFRLPGLPQGVQDMIIDALKGK